MNTPQSAIRNPQLPYQPWLHRFAMLFVVMTFGLLVLGGTVTSKGVGLAVPDWPTTYHYNMFLFPTSMWVGGVFWEHTHRLMGALVGVMAIVMAVWLWRTQSRGRGGRPWLRWAGLAALALVIAQGVMGGFRVTFVNSFPQWALPLAIFHGITAQLFLCLTVLLAAATSKWWLRCAHERKARGPLSAGAASSRGPRRLACALLAVLLVQLTLGAVMRHNGAGLAIPDFPTAYGQLAPPLTQAGINAAIDDLPYDQFNRYYTPAEVGVHFAHRLWAIVVVAVTVWLITAVARRAVGNRLLLNPALALIVLLLSQLALGAGVIWSSRHPEIATAHQAIGAAILATAALLTIRLHVVALPPTRQTEATDGVPVNERSVSQGAAIDAVKGCTIHRHASGPHGITTEGAGA